MAVFQLPFAKVGFNICYEAEIPGVCRDAGGTGCGVNFNAFRYVY